MEHVMACVALGANLGEPATTIARAAGRMDGLLPGVRLAARSRLWHTAPKLVEPMEFPLPEVLRPSGGHAGEGGQGGPWYANMVVRLESPATLAPEELFEALMALEAELGRSRVLESRWGPRPIDIDLLLFGDAIRSTPRLTLPHPRMWLRPFVLLPLSEVAPEVVSREKIEGLSFSSSETVLV